MYSIFIYAYLINSENLYLYACIDMGSHCCRLHVKFNRPINLNGDVPLNKGQNIGAGMPASLPSYLDIDRIKFGLWAQILLKTSVLQGRK